MQCGRCSNVSVNAVMRSVHLELFVLSGIEPRYLGPDAKFNGLADYNEYEGVHFLSFSGVAVSEGVSDATVLRPGRRWLIRTLATSPWTVGLGIGLEGK
jgi:hypothetical protein